MISFLKLKNLGVVTTLLLTSINCFSQHYLEIQRKLKEENRRYNELQIEQSQKNLENSSDCGTSHKNSKCQPILELFYTDGVLRTKKEIEFEKSNALKHKKEIIRRCGLSESENTEITGMKKDENLYAVYRRNLPANWGEVWIATYKIKSNVPVFGDANHIYKYCIINAIDGKSIFIDALR